MPVRRPGDATMSIAAPAEVVAGGSPSWRSLAVLGALFFIVLGVLYSTVLRDLVTQWWEDDNYSHGFIVPLFTAYLIWNRRQDLRTMPIRGSALGLLRSSLIVILAGLVLVHLGVRVFRAVAFPLAFLFFAVPLPAILFYKVAFPLQGLAAQNSAWVLDLLGVPVLLDGNVIHLSRLSLGVVEACSGIRSLISLLALAVAWAYLTLPSALAMTVLIVSAIPITIAANAARIVVTGLVGQSFGMEYAQGFFHSFSGWVIFVFAFVCLLGVHALIRLVSAAWRRHRA
jgi:exosortase